MTYNLEKIGDFGKIDYPTRIVILSERGESKDLSSNFMYLQDLQILHKRRFDGNFLPFQLLSPQSLTRVLTES